MTVPTMSCRQTKADEGELLMHSTIQTMIPARKGFLPYALPSIGEEEIAEVVDTLRSGWLTTGPKATLFENDFAAYSNARNAIAVSSCTAGLLTALTALGIGPGDEVIVPTLTFCATANVVVQLGATPVLVDVGADMEIDAMAARAAITPFTKAIMPVHFGGQPCDLRSIYEMAVEHQLAVVEDAAHAAGAMYRGDMIGADRLTRDYPKLRRATAFSFYANKNMTTGEGGMITTSDDQLAQQMRMLVLHGMSKDAWKRYSNHGSWFYEVVAAGYKFNMTDIAASLGIHQLRRLDEFIAIRRRYAKLYDLAFKDSTLFQTPQKHSDCSHVYHLYPLRLDLRQLTISRAEFITRLKEMNVGASVHFIPLHLQPFYRDHFGYERGDLPQAEAIYDEVLSLPLYPKMSERDVQDVIDAVYYVALNHRR
jgi:dTDP-4-amino-4,6-dideoxygalactose transaminase